VTLGALLGALADGELADGIGRERALLIAGALFTLGAAVQAFAPETIVLVASRLIIGAAVGVAAVAAPLYGRRTCTSFGAGPLCDGLAARHNQRHLRRFSGRRLLSADANWRPMLGAAAIPGLLLFFVALVAPESSRWLMKMHRRDDAAIEMKKIAPIGDDIEADPNESTRP